SLLGILVYEGNSILFLSGLYKNAIEEKGTSFYNKWILVPVTIFFSNTNAGSNVESFSSSILLLPELTKSVNKLFPAQFSLFAIFLDYHVWNIFTSQFMAVLQRIVGHPCILLARPSLFLFAIM
ncbi:hypothetical protein ACJX0J_030758, partial [Zea mays]